MMNFKIQTLQIDITIFALACAVFATAAKNVKDLYYRYRDTRPWCEDTDGNNVPAFACSGIIIRGINTKQNLDHAWDMKPLNIEKQAFSAGYLREDAQFSAFPLGYESGFIIYPHLHTPPNKHVYEVLCAFPHDALTDNREDRGCGSIMGDTTAESSPCHLQGILSKDDWLERYENIVKCEGTDLNITQCAFYMTLPTATVLFETCLQVNTYLMNGTEYAFQNNELKIQSWDGAHAAELPIEAFFYILHSENGLSNALNYQEDYFKQTCERLPIVGIQLPDPNGKEFLVEPFNQTFQFCQPIYLRNYYSGQGKCRCI